MVSYNKIEYLTFNIQSDGAIKFTPTKSATGWVYYSTDAGTTWSPIGDASNPTQFSTGDQVMLKGDLVHPTNGIGYFSATTCNFEVYGNPLSLVYGDEFYKNESTIPYDGTFMRLFYRCTTLTSAEFLQLTPKNLTKNCYKGMFSGCTSLTTAPSVLSAKTLAESCYEGMFGTCRALINPPTLCGETLATSCYKNMFESCSSLTKRVELTATTLAVSCYEGMFNDCSSFSGWLGTVLPAEHMVKNCYKMMFSGCSLNKVDCDPADIYFKPVIKAVDTAEGSFEGMFSRNRIRATWDCFFPKTTELSPRCYRAMYKGNSISGSPYLTLPATELKPYCYAEMFADNTSLRSVKNVTMSAQTLASGCCYAMFSGCSSLTDPIPLPATNLANSCYNSMYSGCTSLTGSTSLPATTLADSCYYGMFSRCKALTTAPELPAITLAKDCYGYMFNDCTKLNYIKAMFTTEPSITYTEKWVSGVASSGTFVKNSAAGWNVPGIHGIPNNWTVQEASA